MLYVLATTIVPASILGLWLGRAIYYGGWDERLTHSCGWFDRTALYRDDKLDRCCPRCGNKDKQWKAIVGRPIPYLPFGWEWKRRPDTEQPSR